MASEICVGSVTPADIESISHDLFRLKLLRRVRNAAAVLLHRLTNRGILIVSSAGSAATLAGSKGEATDSASVATPL